MDYRLPDGDGTDATRHIRDLDEDAPVLLLTGADDPSVVSAALDAGCSGFVTKDRGVDELVGGIRFGGGGARGVPRRPPGPRAERRSRQGVGSDLTAGRNVKCSDCADGCSTDDIGPPCSSASTRSGITYATSSRSCTCGRSWKPSYRRSCRNGGPAPRRVSARRPSPFARLRLRFAAVVLVAIIPGFVLAFLAAGNDVKQEHEAHGHGDARGGGSGQ